MMKRYHRNASALALATSCLLGCSSDRGSDAAAEITSELAANGLAVTLSLTAEWSSGYCAEVKLNNVSARAITTWTVGVELGGATLSNLWNGKSTASATEVLVTPADYSTSLATNASTSFGFCANGTARPTVSSVTSPGITAEISSATGVGGTTVTGSPVATGGTTAASSGAQGGAAPAQSGSSSQTPSARGGSSSPASSGLGRSGSSSGTRGTTVAPSGSGFLYVQGSQLLDDAGRSARLTGVNWFGFETSNLSPHGLWARDYRSMLRQIDALGFNSVRIPWCNAMLRPEAEARSVNTYGADPYDNTDPMNGPLEGKTPLEMMDLIVEAAGELNLKIILDNHSRKPDGYMEEKVWYSEVVSEEQWIADWVFMAEHYRGNPTVVGFDLDNEPHGNATWAAGSADTDWNSAAERCGNAILAANSDALIIVEGVEKVGSDGYWWGGNLSGARSNPIVLSKPDKLVYSAHEYGPEVFNQSWFSDSNFPANMSTIWNNHFGFLMKENLGHVLIGEFGIRDASAWSGTAGTWFETFLAYLGSTYSWSFWCWNPNSGDTEGLLTSDWLTTKQWKLDALKPYLAPQFE